ncbi:MAG: hypothetical protein K8S16_14780 [Bacteroidales bacterium]|nr:hypothetical protein [Bacteroidales bacterium]
MNFEKSYIYHIYNQGNNHRKIFFKRENYLFFLKKIRTYVSPYTDILAWCLMPNHFHLMVLVVETHRATSSHPVSGDGNHRAFNQSIAIMLRSYTRAINKQEDFSGALFREATKAECVNCPSGISPSFFIKDGVTLINVTNPEQEYPQLCFDYIHQNPVKAGLAKNAVDWEFSSAMDYAEIRNGKLVNKEVAAKYVDF